MKQYVVYLRVSTQRQGAQGLGVSAQRNMCENFIKQNKGEQVQEFMDVESGTHRDRKGLWQAIDYCKKNDCSLVIAKLDRLARDVEFTFKVINTGIDIHFTDMPIVNSMVLGVFAAVAQYEREMCSLRTKQALAALKARGDVKLGSANEKYTVNYKNKTEEERMEIHRKKGQTKNLRHLQSKDVRAFAKALRMVFPDACSGNVSTWRWSDINTKKDNRIKVITLMRDYKEIDNELFRSWDFCEDVDSIKLQRKLSCSIANLKASVLNACEDVEL